MDGKWHYSIPILHYCTTAMDADFTPAEKKDLRKMLALFRSAESVLAGGEAQGDTTNLPPTYAYQDPVGAPPFVTSVSSSSNASPSTWEMVGPGSMTMPALVPGPTTFGAGVRKVFRCGGGKCLHKSSCHHVRRRECQPCQLTLCPCIPEIKRGVEYFLDFNKTVHGDTDCNAFEGRASFKVAKVVMIPCTQCF